MEISDVRGKDGNSPLNVAVMHGDLDMGLIKSGADPNI